MSSYAALHGEAGGLFIEHKGKKYTPRLIVQDVKAKVEEAFESKIRKGILKWKGELPPGEFLTLVKEHEAAVNEGRFAFEGKECQHFLTGIDGGILLVSLLFGCDEKTAIELMLEQPDEMKMLLATIKGRSSPNS